MNKEQINNRLEQLREGQKQALAQVNATEGAIQDCLYWLEELEKSNKPNKEDKKVNG
jgi:hypothetical protein